MNVTHKLLFDAIDKESERARKRLLKSVWSFAQSVTTSTWFIYLLLLKFKWGVDVGWWVILSPLYLSLLVYLVVAGPIWLWMRYTEKEDATD